MEITIRLTKSKNDSPELSSTRRSRVLNTVYLILALLSSYIYCISGQQHLKFRENMIE